MDFWVSTMSYNWGHVVGVAVNWTNFSGGIKCMDGVKYHPAHVVVTTNDFTVEYTVMHLP